MNPQIEKLRGLITSGSQSVALKTYAGAVSFSHSGWIQLGYGQTKETGGTERMLQ